MKLKKDDPVVVLSGKYKGKQGTIVKSLPKDNKVVVGGVNVVKRHQKAGAGGAEGIVEKELPIHVSNVAYFDAKSGKASRVGYKRLEDGTKVRVLKASGEQLS
jgi:large subunit ribosomal protein L24